MAQLGKLKRWKCPVCGIVHDGFKFDICRNEKCKNFGKGNWKRDKRKSGV